MLVRKYGGSSLATVERLKEVAADLRRARDRGHRLVVVVSAMGDTTDDLLALARQASREPPRRELDMLLSVGERITASLLAMALADAGCPALSLTGSQCGIITDASHSDARIIEVRGDRVREALARGQAVIVAGFQGVSLAKEITTLGRGGSDTTAVALAAALGAVRCEILKDVDGVMTADPSRVPDARLIERLSWEEMEKIAAAGCGVVHLRAVEYAARHGVEIVVRSSFHDRPGTLIGAPGARRTGGDGADEAAGTCAAAPAPGSAGAAPAGLPEPQSRYRPLALHVHPAMARLRLVTGDFTLAETWRAPLLERLDPARVVAEWLDVSDGYRWEAWAPAAAFGDLAARLRALDAAGAGTVDWQTDLSCISLAGGRPDTWLQVHRHLDGLRGEAGGAPWRVRADGATLRILLDGAEPGDLPARLHRSLLRD
ncbi:MAG: aspartate kinase [bacterium]|nr:aspartate kinase [bacterium]